MKRLFRIGSRASRLALVQAQAVRAMLAAAHPEADFEIVKISTQGDQNRRVSLGRLPGVGFFVKELEFALLEGSIDIAVHSLKDMPVDVPLGLSLAAVSPRVDPRDVLISRGMTLKELPKGAKIGSDSLRRAFQLKAIRPDLEVSSIRGNIETRLKAVETGRFDGVVLAERALLRRLGGGCRAPIAALGTVANGVLTLRGMVADEKGENILKESIAGSAAEAEELGEVLAENLLQMGADNFLS